MKQFVLTMTMIALLGVGSVFAEDRGNSEGNRQDDKNKSAQQIALDATQMACISTAIGKREDALVAGHDAYSLAVKTAYTTRKAALQAAWLKADRAATRSSTRC